MMTAPRIALTIDEAAKAVGMPRRSFERHVLPHLPRIYVGRRRLIRPRDLERWVDAQAVDIRVWRR